MNEQDKIIQEKRLQRIETYLYLLCMHLGINPRSGERLAGDLSNPNAVVRR